MNLRTIIAASAVVCAWGAAGTAHAFDDQKYVAQFLWPLEVEPIDVDELPDSAFDSPEEKTRLAPRLEK